VRKKEKGSKIRINGPRFEASGRKCKQTKLGNGMTGGIKVDSGKRDQPLKVRTVKTQQRIYRRTLPRPKRKKQQQKKTAQKKKAKKGKKFLKRDYVGSRGEITEHVTRGRTRRLISKRGKGKIAMNNATK